MSVEPERASQARIDEEYFQAALGRPLHEIYGILEPYLGSSGTAVDLGCGVGHAALFLLNKGYEVFAVDRSPAALEIVRGRLKPGHKATLVEADMSDWPIPEADVITAGFSLFFLKPGQLEPFWKRLTASLKPGGLFAGQFLGVRDEWAGESHAAMERETLEEMLTPYDVLYFEEAERKGKTVLDRPKYWHVFHVVARKRSV
jgi:trans-aconitate methyltransferase